MNKFTVFCRQADGQGTMWISTVDAENLPDAMHLGREQCASDWDYNHDVQVIGVAAGEVDILVWVDGE